MSEFEKTLDFSDISGTKPTVKKRAAQDKDFGITLALPNGRGKDLARVTGAEFVQWAKNVYPVDLRDIASKLDSKATRYSMFNKIVLYHRDCAYLSGKEKTPADTQH